MIAIRLSTIAGTSCVNAAFEPTQASMNWIDGRLPSLVGYRMSKRLFLLDNFIIVIAVLYSANATADSPAGWIDWADTQIVSSSSPTGMQSPRDQGQLDIVLYADSHFALQAIELGSSPRLVASGKHYDPACFYNGQVVCFGFSVPPAKIASEAAHAASGQSARERAESSYAGAPSKKPTPAQAAGVTCVTLDCQVRAIHGNSLANLSVFVTSTATRMGATRLNCCLGLLYASVAPPADRDRSPNPLQLQLLDDASRAELFQNILARGLPERIAVRTEFRSSTGWTT